MKRRCDNCQLGGKNCPALGAVKVNNSKTVQRRQMSCDDHFVPVDMTKSVFDN